MNLLLEPLAPQSGVVCAEFGVQISCPMIVAPHTRYSKLCAKTTIWLDIKTKDVIACDANCLKLPQYGALYNILLR